MRLLLRLTALFLSVALFTPVCAQPARAQDAEQSKPNFVFILIDDMGWKDVGCNGSTFYQTPNIDHLAAQGMRFTNAYATCPVCSPTRRCCMRGEEPWMPKCRLRTPLTSHEHPDHLSLPPERAEELFRLADRNHPLKPAPG